MLFRSDVGDELIGRGGNGFLVLPQIEVQVVGEAGAPIRPLLAVEEAEVAGLSLLNLFDLVEVLRRLLWDHGHGLVSYLQRI